MLRPYIFCFNEKVGTLKDVADFLDTKSEILNWYSCMPQTIFFVSAKSLTQLMIIFQAKYVTGNYFFSTIDAHTCNGLLPKEAWDFITEPKSSGKWPV